LQCHLYQIQLSNLLDFKRSPSINFHLTLRGVSNGCSSPDISRPWSLSPKARGTKKSVGPKKTFHFKLVRDFNNGPSLRIGHTSNHKNYESAAGQTALSCHFGFGAVAATNKGKIINVQGVLRILFITV